MQTSNIQTSGRQKSDNIRFFSLSSPFGIQSFYWAIKPHNFNLKLESVVFFSTQAIEEKRKRTRIRELWCLKLNCMHRIPGFSSIFKRRSFFSDRYCRCYFIHSLSRSVHFLCISGAFVSFISWWFPILFDEFDFIGNGRWASVFYLNIKWNPLYKKK